MTFKRSTFILLISITMFGILKALESCASMSDFHDSSTRIHMTLGYS